MGQLTTLSIGFPYLLISPFGDDDALFLLLPSIILLVSFSDNKGLIDKQQELTMIQGLLQLSLIQTNIKAIIDCV